MVFFITASELIRLYFVFVSLAVIQLSHLPLNNCSNAQKCYIKSHPKCVQLRNWSHYKKNTSLFMVDILRIEWKTYDDDSPIKNYKRVTVIWKGTFSQATNFHLSQWISIELPITFWKLGSFSSSNKSWQLQMIK